MKYIQAIIRRFVSLVHCFFIKIIHWRKFQFKFEEMISSSSHFHFNGDGMIIIGKRVGIRNYCDFSISEKGNIKIGNDCFFNRGCIVVSHNNIVIGNHTRFGPNVLIYDHDYDFTNNDESQRNKHISSPIVIGDNVWIGAGCIILRGTVIGDNCVIGAGSVIKGKIESNTLITQRRNEYKRSIVYDKI